MLACGAPRGRPRVDQRDTATPFLGGFEQHEVAVHLYEDAAVHEQVIKDECAGWQ